jgi:predicted DNA-binding ribbon-helix-helix protein
VRTTIDIEAPILKELKAIQKREGVTLGVLVSRLLAEGLARRGDKSTKLTLTWVSRPMRARLDIADKEALHAILDDPRETVDP